MDIEIKRENFSFTIQAEVPEFELSESEREIVKTLAFNLLEVGVSAERITLQDAFFNSVRAMLLPKVRKVATEEAWRIFHKVDPMRLSDVDYLTEEMVKAWDVSSVDLRSGTYVTAIKELDSLRAITFTVDVVDLIANDQGLFHDYEIIVPGYEQMSPRMAIHCHSGELITFENARIFKNK